MATKKAACSSAVPSLTTIMSNADLVKLLLSLRHCLGDVRRVSQTCRELSVALGTNGFWEECTKLYFRVTLANPPILPVSLKGRSRFEYLTDFNKRNVSLLAAQSRDVWDELMQIGGGSLDCLEKKIGKRLMFWDGQAPSYRADQSRLPYSTLLRMIDLAKELAERGEQQALPSMLRYSPDTLEPGMLIMCSIPPSDDEVSRRAQIGATLYTQPLHCTFTQRCVVNEVVNGMVSLITCQGDFKASGAAPWVYDELDKYGHIRPNNLGMAEASLHAFQKTYCVPRANVLYRKGPFYSNEGREGFHAPVRNYMLCALGQASEVHGPEWSDGNASDHVSEVEGNLSDASDSGGESW